MKKLYILLLIVFCSSCIIKEEKTYTPKSYVISSIKNKGVILEKNVIYCQQGVLTIKTNNDIVKEVVGDITVQPTSTIFKLLSVSDTIK